MLGADSNGQTALTIASFRGHTDIVRLLIDAGAALDLKGACFWSCPTAIRSRMDAEKFGDKKIR